ncbi:SMC family ATPase [Microbacterium sp. ET2]|uniref:AAA family ATPase n=1 Tax=Microbacterium albipurpureum TaxID=3050384 RepID=UPI00259CDE1C|nr:SMC family ATPase [Microbacterium sp. ET2 (Ac-2212)]WJL96489.1 SMC family ATPase [Microbacterium sp. ET2 (Ac-2212)]
MKLHRVELEGFGPFRERQVVDLDAFEADGIFLISGRTGAGKSSVLDGVCFALYGGVPRYDGAEKRLRSDHCGPDDPTSVAVEFTTAGRRFRVTRSPDYPRRKRRGEGFTVVAADAELAELVDGAWRGFASGPRQVGMELDEILGLSQQQFLQVILLAQNRFAEFLLAKNDDRQKLLRRLFGTRTYEDYLHAFEERRRAVEREVADATGAAALLLSEAERLFPVRESGGASDDELMDDAGTTSATDTSAVGVRLEAVERGAQRADYRAETLRNARDSAEAAHRRAEDHHAAVRRLRQMQEDRVRSRAALADLEAEIPAVDLARRELAAARDAEALRAPLDAADAADAERVAATRAVQMLVDELGAEEGDFDLPTLSLDELDALVLQLTGDLAVWREAQIVEKTVDTAEQALADDVARIRHEEELIARLDADRARIPVQRAAVEVELAPVRDAAAGVDAARTRRDEAQARHDAAAEAADLAPLTVIAEEASLATAEAAAAANEAVVSLLRRRAADRAGSLAADLVDGEPCPVCGSADHPHPAEPTSDPISDDDIERVEAAQQRAGEQARRAAEEFRSAREAQTHAAARAGGLDLDDAAAALVAAEAALAAGEKAVTERDRLLATLETLTLLEAEAARERERLTAHLAALRERVSAHDAELREKRRVVAAARGDHDSVAARVHAATLRRDRATRLAAARRAAETARAAADRAAADRDDRVAASGFGDVVEARVALRAAAARDALDEGIRTHEAALRAERDRLRDLELALAGEPEELVDVSAAEAALIVARDAWVAAVDAAADAGATAERLRALRDRARAALDDVAELADEHQIVARLADTVAGRAPNTRRMTLESFVLAAELEEIVAAANLRLGDMSSGRYQLRHTDALAARGAASGLGLEILDAHTGAARPAHSLSGGETFLASLALALGLAEVVTARAGGVRLDTLFIDEGFGSLDDDTLELAMATLDELRQGGRTVGLISHVATMKERIPAQLHVRATPQGPSIIRQDAAVAASLLSA